MPNRFVLLLPVGQWAFGESREIRVQKESSVQKKSRVQSAVGKIRDPCAK